nr:MAG TPA: hypothetical protein [Caudoviricetes sp.]DAH33658.1 MAG TPA: hypothetical protein [Caudoviricetes sp.]DAI82786.1 MAG TPA: hypothetical protein [Caudoviricetes sp.]DAJ03925.1 MAG TPA: hypothetical protein [Caudoviricetes sp.]DAM00596.1 MAG TPA: hypothetical protein [Caudoviricetes sp.]
MRYKCGNSEETTVATFFCSVAAKNRRQGKGR